MCSDVFGKLTKGDTTLTINKDDNDFDLKHLKYENIFI